MTSTEKQQASEVETVIRDTLAAHHSMYLATAGTAGPWNSGVYFAEVDPFTLVLVLETYGRTLTAIRENPVVALVVSTGSPGQPFLQGRPHAEILEGEDDAEVRRVLLAKVPEAAPFMDAPITAVRLKVPSWRATDVMNGWLPGKELAAPGS